MVKAAPPSPSTARSSERMRRLFLQVWEVARCRYNSGIGQPKREQRAWFLGCLRIAAEMIEENWESKIPMELARSTARKLKHDHGR